MAQINFNVAEYEPDAGGFGEPIPVSWQKFTIDESSLEPTKDNATTGNMYIKLRFSIMDGPYKGRKLFKQFNVKNTSPEAETIGRRQFSAVTHAVGMPGATDTQQLHGIPLQGKVVIEKGSKKPNSEEFYPDRNDINTFKNINEVVPEIAAAPAAAPAVANPFATKPPVPAAAAPAFAQPPAAAPAVPAVPVPPVPPVPAVPAAVAFPPEGWTAHPTAPGFFYKGQEVLAEADLRAKTAAPAVPAVPAVPAAPAAAPAAAGATPPWAR